MTKINQYSQIKNRLKKAYLSLLACHDEPKKLISFLKTIKSDQTQHVLDVGCGYGRILKLLPSSQYNVTGVEINKQIVQTNKNAGFNCIDLDEFKKNKKLYDIIIMFHIIEHFSPGLLLEIMDFYLDHLKIGGYLTIATPIMTKYFYEDFDHVRPYDPVGIEMVFGTSKAQVQYYSKNKLKLINLVYKKYPYRLTHQRGLHLKTRSRYFIMFFHFLSACVFVLSGGIVGKKDGWIGLYQKVA